MNTIPAYRLGEEEIATLFNQSDFAVIEELDPSLSTSSVELNSILLAEGFRVAFDREIPIEIR
jgi:hypothetical protein